MKRTRKPAMLPLVAALLLAPACAGGPAQPVPIDTRHDACAHCRMTASDPRLAAQIVAPGEEPMIFDDLGCLREHLAGRAPLPDGAGIFVADHRTGDWIRADRALFTRAPRLDTPMGSHLIAHLDAASRDRDPDAEGGEPVGAREVLAGRWPPAGPARNGESR
jgi:copper chaperone NosL